MRRVGGARATGSLPARPLVVTLLLAIVFGVLLGRFVFLRAPQESVGVTAAGSSLEGAVAAVRAAPTDPAALRTLGLAHLAAARATADPSSFARAAEALERSDRLAADDPKTLTALGLVALARHDFAGALVLGERAAALTPAAAEPLGVIVDAQTELGRYDAALATVQRMVDLRPTMASLSRASYLAELHGDRARAITLMQQALVAGGGSTGDRAYVLSLLGELRLAAGDLRGAEQSFLDAARLEPSAAAGTIGRARVAAAAGDLDGAAGLLGPLVRVQPLPDAVTLLGDVKAAQGDTAGASAQYDLVRAIEMLNRDEGGVAVDLELARFEATHGSDTPRAVDLAEQAAAVRPTVYADDTRAWALHRAGRSREALPLAEAATRLETADAVLWWHRAEIEAAVGREAEARTHVRRALELSPWFGVRETPAARSLLERLG